MKIYLLLISLAVISTFTAKAQRKTENIIVVTLDGMRWQEVFNGADPVLLKNSAFTKDSESTSSKFWNDTLNIRRKK